MKNGMNTFLGCKVNEQRVGTMVSLLNDSIYTKLEKQGYLQGETKGNRKWFSLTEKGKMHVRPREIALSQL